MMTKAEHETLRKAYDSAQLVIDGKQNADPEGVPALLVQVLIVIAAQLEAIADQIELSREEDGL